MSLRRISKSGLTCPLLRVIHAAGHAFEKGTMDLESRGGSLLLQSSESQAMDRVAVLELRECLSSASQHTQISPAHSITAQSTSSLFTRLVSRHAIIDRSLGLGVSENIGAVKLIWYWQWSTQYEQPDSNRTTTVSIVRRW